jgi:hypothetical protein
LNSPGPPPDPNVVPLDFSYYPYSNKAYEYIEYLEREIQDLEEMVG